MNSLYDNVYDVIFAPRTAFRRITEERPLGQAAIVFTLSVLVPIIPMYFVMKPAGVKFIAGAFCSLQFAGSLLMWFLSAAVWSLTAELFGGNGKSSSLFAALGFSHLPRMLMVPALVFASLLPVGLKQFAEVVFILATVIWTFVLDIAAIRETYSLSGAKAALVVAAPILACVILMILAGILIGTMVTEFPFNFNNVLVE